jgi:hypothetical protein
MIANIPPSEKSAFFGLLDEYFASRPERLPSLEPGSAGIPAPARANLGDRATAAAGAAASAAVSGALRDQFSRAGLGGAGSSAAAGKGPQPPVPSSAKPGFLASAVRGTHTDNRVSKNLLVVPSRLS